MRKTFRVQLQDPFSAVVARRLSPTRSGMTGRSSIPEAVVIEPRSLGVLDAPHARGMTAVGDANLRSRGTKCPSCWKRTALKSEEGAGNAGCALHPRPRVRKKAHALATKGAPQQPAFPAQWFYGLYVISPVTMLG